MLKAMQGAAQEEPATKETEDLSTAAKETQKPIPDGVDGLREKRRKVVHFEDPPETGGASSSAAATSAEGSAPQKMEPPASDEGQTASK